MYHLILISAYSTTYLIIIITLYKHIIIYYLLNFQLSASCYIILYIILIKYSTISYTCVVQYYCMKLMYNNNNIITYIIPYDIIVLYIIMFMIICDIGYGPHRSPRGVNISFIFPRDYIFMIVHGTLFVHNIDHNNNNNNMYLRKMIVF